MKRSAIGIVIALSVSLVTTASAQRPSAANAQTVSAALSSATRQRLIESLRKAAAYLGQKQKADDTWENHPGINAMVAIALLR